MSKPNPEKLRILDLSSLSKHHKEAIFEFLLSRSLDIVEDFSQDKFIVKSPSKSKISRFRSKLRSPIATGPSRRVSPRTGLHRAVSVGIVTYKGGLTPVKQPLSARKSVRSSITPTYTTPERKVEGTLLTSSSKKYKSFIRERTVYPSFFSLFEIPRGSRAKRMNLHTLLRLVEEIYEAKFKDDSIHFKASLKERTSDEFQLDRSSFPLYVWEFLKEKHKHTKGYTQAAMDLVASLEFHKEESAEASIFVNFLNETYDSKDLVFYLYNRSVLENLLGLDFSNLTPEDTKRKTGVLYISLAKFAETTRVNIDIRHVHARLKECLDVCQAFFSPSQHPELFQSLSDAAVVASSGKKYVSVTTVLETMLEHFHKSRSEATPHKKPELLPLVFEELERMLNRKIREKSTLDSQSEEIIKTEMLNTFKKHIAKMVELLQKGDKKEMKRFFELSEEENGIEYVNWIIDELNQLGERPDKMEEIAVAILNVPPLLEQIEYAVDKFFGQGGITEFS